MEQNNIIHEMSEQSDLVLHPVTQDFAITEDVIRKPFIEANTVESSLIEIQQKHIIPVWLKDNEPMISHGDFIESTSRIVSDVFHGEHILKPSIRLSHPIKGRIPSAKDKPAHLLTDEERTLFYERMMFVIEIPSIRTKIDGSDLSLTIGGVKSFSEDNLYQRLGGEQHFKVFIGFQNKVCTNLCVWTDGYLGNLKVKTKEELIVCIYSILRCYDQNHHLFHLNELAKYSLTEQQFAYLIGRCRMYNYLPNKLRQEIPPILMGEQQMGAVVRDYYRDGSFCRESDGSINLWKLYNLFTDVNKSSYINSFLDRAVNTYHLIEQVRWALQGKQESWYIH